MILCGALPYGICKQTWLDFLLGTIPINFINSCSFWGLTLQRHNATSVLLETSVQDIDDGVHGHRKRSGTCHVLTLTRHALAIVEDEQTELVARLDALLQLRRLDRRRQIDFSGRQAPEYNARNAQIDGAPDMGLAVLLRATAVQQD